MYHSAKKGIRFGDLHSYDDLNLILSSSYIPPALPKTNYIDIPGGNGSLDLTEAHGKILYNDRECKFTFTVIPGDNLTWDERKTDICNKINGKTFRLTDDRDPEYYYFGRCTVNEYLTDRLMRQIVITAHVQPYKYRQSETIVNFDLTSDLRTVSLKNGRKPVVPVIECTNDNTMIVFNGTSVSISAGSHKILNIELTYGYNEIQISGTGTVTFRYQEGDL